MLRGPTRAPAPRAHIVCKLVPTVCIHGAQTRLFPCRSRDGAGPDDVLHGRGTGLQGMIQDRQGDLWGLGMAATNGAGRMSSPTRRHPWNGAEQRGCGERYDGGRARQRAARCAGAERGVVPRLSGATPRVRRNMDRSMFDIGLSRDDTCDCSAWSSVNSDSAGCQSTCRPAIPAKCGEAWRSYSDVWWS